MKDFYKSPVKVGDKVICMVKNYRSLQEAVVTKVTEKTITVEYQAHWTSNPHMESYKLNSDQFVVVDSKPF